VIKQQKENNSEITSKKLNENTKILFLSICGTVKVVGGEAHVAEQFSSIVWAKSGLATSAYEYAYKDLTDFYISTVYPLNYLHSLS